MKLCVHRDSKNLLLFLFCCGFPPSPRSGLKDLYSASQKQLDTEMKLRHDIEKELEVQRNLRSEKEACTSS